MPGSRRRAPAAPFSSASAQRPLEQAREDLVGRAGGRLRARGLRRARRHASSRSMLASSRLATSSRTLASRSGGTPEPPRQRDARRDQQRVARLGDPARRRRAVQVIQRAQLIDRQPFDEVLLQQQAVRAVQRGDRLGERRLEVRHVLALQELQLGIALRFGQHRDQLVAHRDLGRLGVAAAAVDERARRGDADPVLQEPLTGVRSRCAGGRSARRRAGAGHREQLRAQAAGSDRPPAAPAVRSARGARDLVAVDALEPVQRAVDAARARAREVEIAGAQVIPPARDVRFVVVVQARGQLAREVVARDPDARHRRARLRPARRRGALPTRAAAPGRCGARCRDRPRNARGAPSITSAIIEGRRGAEQGPPRDGPRAGASPTFRSDETAPGRSRERRGTKRGGRSPYS